MQSVLPTAASFSESNCPSPERSRAFWKTPDVCSMPGSQRQPILGDGKLVGKFGKLLGKFFNRSPVMSTHIVLSKHDRGGASQRCAGPVGKQACDLNSLLLVICGVGCVLDLVQSRPRCGHTIRLRFMSRFPLTPSGMQFACQTVQSPHGLDTAVCPHVYDAC